MIKNKFNSFAYDIIANFRPETINGLCQAKFRLSSRYRDQPAPFGFDWVRTGDSVDYVSFDVPYKKNMGRYYTNSKKTELCRETEESSHFNIDTEMYNSLCENFLPGSLLIFPTRGGKMRRYHVPVLSIYPYSSQHPIIAYLSLEIQIKSKILSIQLEYNRSLLEINMDNSISTQKGKHVYEISIKCIKEFAQDEYIHVTSINSRGKERKAGTLRICKNAKKFRFQTHILLVNIKFFFPKKNSETPYVGEIGGKRKHIERMLQHAFIFPLFDIIEMDLGYDRELNDRLYGAEGEIYLLTNTTDINSQKEVNCQLSTYLTEKVKAIKDIKNYSAIMYILGTRLMYYEGEEQQPLSGITTGKHIMLGKQASDITATHELLHAFGLKHSFDNYFTDNSTLAPFTHRLYNTDNIMDYTHINKIERTNLWEWQWKKIREMCTPES